MNRLTKSSPLPEWEAMNLSMTDLYMRLKAYEDTGLEPEECAKYAQAEKEGRLLALPCKVGGTAFIVRTDKKCTCGWIVPCHVSGIHISDYGRRGKEINHCLILRSDMCGFTNHVPIEQSGKTVFLTREEAEKALRQEVKDNA